MFDLSTEGPSVWSSDFGRNAWAFGINHSPPPAPRALPRHYGAATGRGASAPPPEGYDAAKDLQVAKRALDDYILKWSAARGRQNTI